MTKFKTGPAIVVMSILAVGAVLTLYYDGFFTLTPSSPSTKIDRFTIYEESTGEFAGMNGSYYKLNQKWPVINVHVNDTVMITLINPINGSEPHGFAINDYFPFPGTTISPGQTKTIRFVANRVGSFIMFCSIFCSIHPYMENGEFIVSS